MCSLLKRERNTNHSTKLVYRTVTPRDFPLNEEEMIFFEQTISESENASESEKDSKPKSYIKVSKDNRYWLLLRKIILSTSRKVLDDIFTKDNEIKIDQINEVYDIFHYQIDMDFYCKIDIKAKPQYMKQKKLSSYLSHIEKKLNQIKNSQFTWQHSCSLFSNLRFPDVKFLIIGRPLNNNDNEMINNLKSIQKCIDKVSLVMQNNYNAIRESKRSQQQLVLLLHYKFKCSSQKQIKLANSML
ncbi:hypothetical protein TRFO_13160 [Tritrichomonas foetus]|uniref:Uncharacterized protein n=1 Tax=Tritrichomonas foetus TaxID=1144522 RepID=A0A1J4KZI3_9EUKA|nr:hypothetical protein TRFO_13160 [Tritrichomonas foetus]|eukprot:OHT16562.1 hypothetical protein TRFO_13160 [Tritrichomonas foetus]